MDEVQIPTTDPNQTLSAIEAVLDRWHGFVALGIASFGPISIDCGSASYGHITATPKPGWTNTDVAGRLARRTQVPTGFHTAVVGAALAEARWGAAQGLQDLAYVTVGNGIGVGLVAGGEPVDGLTHSEFGHIRPARQVGDLWPGVCPFHGDCLEGLASAPAIAARVGEPGQTLAPDNTVWDGVAHALGQLLHTLVLTGVPRRIIMGGVMVGTARLFPRVRTAMTRSLTGYVSMPEVAQADTYVVPPALGDRAGPLGAIVLGEQAFRS
ncbi:Fructokinase [Novosphingobium sp. 9U]|nr:Fructokinase [Novosphingobium sp. 9U]